jgi:hypothetical protein
MSEPDSASAPWRVLLEVETSGPDGRRRMCVDLPRSDKDLAELHELARLGAEHTNLLHESTTSITVRVHFPDA